MKNFLNLTFYSIFWIWNVTFLGAVYFWILPTIGWSLIEDTLSGLIPSQFLITFIGIVAIPTIFTIIGGWYFRKQPLQLFRLFYGVEAPLFLLCLLRFFVLRELTQASTLILATIFISIIAFALEMLYGYANRNKLVSWLQMFAHSLMLLTGLYVGVLLLFYAVPVSVMLVREFFSFYWLQGIISELTYSPGYVFTLLLFLFVLALTTTLFVFMPSALASLYVNSGQRILRTFANQHGHQRTFQGIIAVITAWMILFVSFQQQPQVVAFQMLDLPVRNESDRQELLANSNLIKDGLVNAYLSSYRYLSTAARSNQIRIMYRSTFGLPESINQTLQDYFNNLMSPFLYKGDDKDKQKAAKLYSDFFDTPIQKAEQKAIINAIQSTANLDEVKAGLLNIGEQKVWLKNQEITVKENRDWADIELYEIYENQTFEPQEILYYFTLPESAVITGIWLGDTDNRAQRFPFKVSPRGAAQKVYNSQVRRERPVDPALLEKVGPRQYRLRAFPVPAKLSVRERKTNPDRPTQMHLWLTYQVMAKDNSFALPKLREKRNIYWNKNTKRIYNTKSVRGDREAWLPSSLTAVTQTTAQQHQINFANGYQISAQPLVTRERFLPESERFAVVVDTSYSMRAKTKELKQNIDWLVANGLGDLSFSNGDADIYLTNVGFPPERIDDISQFDAEKVTFFGTLQYQEMLEQFLQLRGDTRYNGLILVTDEGSYELSDDTQEMPNLSTPLWMLHLGAMPPAYDDATLKLMQKSGGGVATQLTEVFQQVTAKSKLGKSVVSVADGYAWFMEKKSDEEIIEDNFAPLAAQQLVLGLSKKMNLDTLDELDAIHPIAKTYKIVTPYSSMIVLVNDEQREALKRAEAAADRFNRKVEDGKEELTDPNNPLDAANVPEPGMVLGMVAMGIALWISQSSKFKS
ncbi:TIGR02921 family PEP-CTERM protein [Okeania hirsuta]|uniref:TIGR02921 family PEP-CTERM protein n=1 Tax=Okeania hirsuta TaxID=1458930 RepID=A0A3N6NWX5_9CYAN|nr:TIGR02921 family PEP-CTERM protein [Okeania hirsuta]RQH57488.1 TIGR02921 family PEP-CTERM protein [Okeania hirsuta]